MYLEEKIKDWKMISFILIFERTDYFSHTYKENTGIFMISKKNIKEKSWKSSF